MHRSLIPGTGSSPTRTPSALSIAAGSPVGTNPVDFRFFFFVLDLRFAMSISVTLWVATRTFFHTIHSPHRAADPCCPVNYTPRRPVRKPFPKETAPKY